jgi:hypothetical protein
MIQLSEQLEFNHFLNDAFAQSKWNEKRNNLAKLKRSCCVHGRTHVHYFKSFRIDCCHHNKSLVRFTLLIGLKYDIKYYIMN